jgi:large subunit ribosomal protein L24
MCKKFKIKKDDVIIVTTGRDKGKKGTVTKVLKKLDKIIVSGVNLAKKHVKPSSVNSGGIIEKELPIHISNVALYDSSVNQASKIGYKIEDGKKLRFFKKSLNVVS